METVEDPHLEAAERRLTWLVPIADQIAREVGLATSEEVDDLTIFVYCALLDDPQHWTFTRNELLKECRQRLHVWLRERGVDPDQVRAVVSTVAAEGAWR